VKVIDSGTDLIGKNLYNYSANISNVARAAGVTYWLSIYSNDSPTNYAWANSSVGSIDGVVRFSGLDWIEYDNNDRSNHVFSLGGPTAPIPESSSFVLLGSGAMGVMFVRCIRRRTKSWQRSIATTRILITDGHVSHRFFGKPSITAKNSSPIRPT